MNDSAGRDPAARRAALHAQIETGTKFPDEFSLLSGLIQLMDCALQYPVVVEALREGPRVKQQDRTRCATTRLLAARMRRTQLTRLIFLRRSHLAFLIQMLQTPGVVAPEDLPRFLAALRQHVADKHYREIDLAVREEIAFLKHRARDGYANDDQEEATADTVDVLLRTPDLDEYDVFTDIVRLLTIAGQFTKLLRRNHKSIELSYRALGSQPVAHVAKSIEGLCRRWHRSTLPDLINELLQMNMQVSVLSTLDCAADLETVDGFNGCWQRELWPSWLSRCIESELAAADSFVKAVLELHELGPE